MIPENAQKWVAALRSGNYQQARNTLRSLKGYCCLGVACEVYRIEHPGVDWQAMEVGTVFSFESYTRVLPDSVRDWLGLATHVGRYSEDTDSTEDIDLTAANDSGLSFAAIADIIESNPPGLFVS